jgi:uncharacterized protein YndB with AHSA1/START domain
MTNGTFLLADIGGYTSFLTDVGIEHAKEITSHLFNGMVDVEPDRWKVGNVAGDCLFLYNDSGDSDEETFEYLRRLYEKFRDSIAVVAAGSTCGCGACDRSGDLTLKFVVHTGEFDIQEIAGRRELIGSEIVVAHRLLKNSIPVHEYALLTMPVAGVAKASGLSAEAGRDEYEDVGGLDYVYLDLRPVRDAFNKSREVYVTEENADVTASIEIDAPPELVWRATLDQDVHTQWVPTLVESETLSGEPDEVGSVHTCLHDGGMKLVHFTVAVDKNRRRRTDKLMNVPLVGEMYQTWEAEPTATGTKFSFHYAIMPDAPVEEGAGKSLVLDVVRQQSDGDVQGLKALCEARVRESEPK